VLGIGYWGNCIGPPIFFAKRQRQTPNALILMTTFAYTALEPSGKRKSGFIDAASRDAAMSAIQSEGRFVPRYRRASGKQGKTRPRQASRSGKEKYLERTSHCSRVGWEISRRRVCHWIEFCRLLPSNRKAQLFRTSLNRSWTKFEAAPRFHWPSRSIRSCSRRCSRRH